MIKGIDYPGVSCGCILHDGNGNFLLSLRSSNTRDEQLTWEFGGGSLELGESAESHVRREIREELGLELSDPKLLDTISVIRSVDDKTSHWIVYIWASRIDPSQPISIQEPQSIIDAKWFSKETLPTKLHSMVPYFLKVGIKHGII